MPEEVSKTTEVKKTSDGRVNISVEKYEELREQAAIKPPVINRTQVMKTDAMLAKECRLWGGGFMGLGASLFAVGAGIFRAGLSK